MAYIIKAYESDGEFYGYAAKHPEEPDMPYYDEDRTNAIRFDSYIEASDYVVRYSDTSELECIIIEDTPKVNKLAEVITEWVKQNYGEAEACNPSWDIDSLASTIEKATDK